MACTSSLLMKKLQIYFYIFALIVAPLFTTPTTTWAAEPSGYKPLSGEPDKTGPRKYQEPDFAYKGEAAFIQNFPFQVANLPGVSVLAVERFIEALDRLGVSRTTFEAGNVPKEMAAKALETLINHYGLGKGAEDKASKEMLKEFKVVKNLVKNKGWRGEYGKFYATALKPLIIQALNQGVSPLELAKAEPKEVRDINPETGKIDRWLRFEFQNPIKGEKPLVADMHLPNTDHLMKFGPRQIAAAGVQAAKALPIESAMFYLANNFMAMGSHFIDPLSNPHGIQDMLGMYFSKKTVLDYNELFHFYTFILGSRISTSLMDFGLKRAGASAMTQMLAAPFMNYIGLASGSMVSSFIADGMTSAKNCYLGYFDNPDNFKDMQEKEFQMANCDLAYERWIRGKMAWKYTGDAITLMMAAAASAIAGKAIGKGKLAAARGAAKGGHALKVGSRALRMKSKNAVLKKVLTKTASMANRVVVTGLKITKGASTVATGVPVPQSKIVGFGMKIGHFIMFLFWHKMVNALVVKPYKSWDVAGEVDHSEDKLLESFRQFRQENWIIESKKPPEKCGNLLQRAAGNQQQMLRLIESGQGLKCYDDTILEDLDRFADDQKDWRDMLMEEANMSYSTWTEQTMKVVDKYYATYLFYQDFVQKVRNKSNLVFGDSNPYGGLNGIVSHPFGEEYLPDDGTRTLEEISQAQHLNIRMQAGAAAVWLANLKSKEGRSQLWRSYATNHKKHHPDKIITMFNNQHSSMVKNLEFVHKGLSSSKTEEVKKAIEKIWELDTYYKDYCVSQIQTALKGVSENLKKDMGFDDKAIKKAIGSKDQAESDKAKKTLNEYLTKFKQKSSEVDTQPFCYFSELRRRFGNHQPGKNYSRKYLEEASAQIAGQGIDVTLFPKKLEDIKTENAATYLLGSMACGRDLDSRQSWWKRILPGVKADTSERGWRMTWGEKPKSSVKSAFGFKMDFVPPLLIPRDENYEMLCRNRYWIGRTAPPGVDIRFDPYELKGTIYNDREYKRLIDMVAENINPAVLDDYSEPGSGFESWWADYVGIDFNEVLDVADTGYRKMLRDKFMPAIFGFKKNLETDVDLMNCSYGNNQKNVIVNEDPSLPTGARDWPEAYRGYKHGGEHMYPPRYFKRSQIRACSASRYKYNPIINSTRLEFQIYLDHLLKPLFLDMFAKTEGSTEKTIKKASEVFDRNRNWILTSLDMLLRYDVTETGAVKESHVPIAESWLHLNMEALKLRLGLPVDPQMRAAMRNMEARVDFIDPDLEAFPFNEWERRRNHLQELVNRSSQGGVEPSQWRQIEQELQRQSAVPWNQLTEDQRQLALAIFRKMTSVTKELAQYRRMITDVKFKMD